MSSALPAFLPWSHGTEPGRVGVDPPIQVQRIDERTLVMRQSMDVDHEAPFLYLLFGERRAFLLDTGATADAGAFPLRAVVDGLLEEYLGSHPHPGYGLVVAHSHRHGDHIAGDVQFAGRPDTEIVGAELAEVVAFFGFGDDLDVPVVLELGGRTLELLRIPGHEATSIAVFDPATGWLLTGDTVYPGRLYVDDPAAFAASISRLVRFADARRASAVMGCHVEMTSSPRVDYPAGTGWQPHEAPLPMSIDQLARIAAAGGVAAVAGRHVYDDFVIVSEAREPGSAVEASAPRPPAIGGRT